MKGKKKSISLAVHTRDFDTTLKTQKNLFISLNSFVMAKDNGE